MICNFLMKIQMIPRVGSQRLGPKWMKVGPKGMVGPMWTAVAKEMVGPKGIENFKSMVCQKWMGPNPNGMDSFSLTN